MGERICSFGNALVTLQIKAGVLMNQQEESSTVLLTIAKTHSVWMSQVQMHLQAMPFGCGNAFLLQRRKVGHGKPSNLFLFEDPVLLDINSGKRSRTRSTFPRQSMV